MDSSESRYNHCAAGIINQKAFDKNQPPKLLVVNGNNNRNGALISNGKLGFPGGNKQSVMMNNGHVTGRGFIPVETYPSNHTSEHHNRSEMRRMHDTPTYYCDHSPYDVAHEYPDRRNIASYHEIPSPTYINNNANRRSSCSHCNSTSNNNNNNNNNNIHAGTTETSYHTPHHKKSADNNRGLASPLPPPSIGAPPRRPTSFYPPTPESMVCDYYPPLSDYGNNINNTDVDDAYYSHHPTPTSPSYHSSRFLSSPDPLRGPPPPFVPSPSVNYGSGYINSNNITANTYAPTPQNSPNHLPNEPLSNKLHPHPPSYLPLLQPQAQQITSSPYQHYQFEGKYDHPTPSPNYARDNALLSPNQGLLRSDRNDEPLLDRSPVLYNRSSSGGTATGNGSYGGNGDDDDDDKYRKKGKGGKHKDTSPPPKSNNKLGGFFDAGGGDSVCAVFKHFAYRLSRMLCCMLCIRHVCSISLSGLCLGVTLGMFMGIYIETCGLSGNGGDLIGGFPRRDSGNLVDTADLLLVDKQRVAGLKPEVGDPFPYPLQHHHGKHEYDHRKSSNLLASFFGGAGGAYDAHGNFKYHSMQEDAGYKPRVISASSSSKKGEKAALRPAGSVHIVRPVYLATELGILPKTALVFIAGEDDPYPSDKASSLPINADDDSRITDIVLRISAIEDSLKRQFGTVGSPQAFTGKLNPSLTSNEDEKQTEPEPETYVSIEDGTLIFHNTAAYSDGGLGEGTTLFSNLLAASKAHAAANGGTELLYSHNPPVIGKILCFVRASPEDLRSTFKYYFPHLLPTVILPPGFKDSSDKGSKDAQHDGDDSKDMAAALDEDEVLEEDAHDLEQVEQSFDEKSPEKQVLADAAKDSDAKQAQPPIPDGKRKRRGAAAPPSDDIKSDSGPSSNKNNKMVNNSKQGNSSNRSMSIGNGPQLQQQRFLHMFRKYVRFIPIAAASPAEYVASTINYLSDHHGSDSDTVFIARAEGTYLRLTQFLDFLGEVRRGQETYVGHPISRTVPHGSSNDARSADAHPLSLLREDYCALETGFLLGQAELLNVRTNLATCLDDTKLFEMAGHKDFERYRFQHILGTCISQILQRKCQSGINGKSYTVSKFSSFLLANSGSIAVDTLKVSSATFNDSLLVYEVSNKFAMLGKENNKQEDKHDRIDLAETRERYFQLDAYFNEVDIRTVEVDIEHVKSELEYLSQYIPNADKDTFFTYGIPPRSRPTNHFDVISWTYFNTTHALLPTEVETIAELSEIEQLETQEVIQFAKTQFLARDPSLTFVRFLNGYKQNDPARGIEYILDFDFLRARLTSNEFPGNDEESVAQKYAHLFNLGGKNLVHNNENGQDNNPDPNLKIVSKRCHIMRPLGENFVSYVKNELDTTTSAAAGANFGHNVYHQRVMAAALASKEASNSILKKRSKRDAPPTTAPKETPPNNGNEVKKEPESPQGAVDEEDRQPPGIESNEADANNNIENNPDKFGSQELSTTLIKYVLLPLWARDCPGPALETLHSLTSDEPKDYKTSLRSIDNARLLLVFVTLVPPSDISSSNRNSDHQTSITSDTYSSLTKTFAKLQSDRLGSIKREAVALKKSGVAPNLGWFTLPLPGHLMPHIYAMTDSQIKQLITNATSAGNNNDNAISNSSLKNQSSVTQALIAHENALLNTFTYNGSLPIRMVDGLAQKLQEKYGDDRYPWIIPPGSALKITQPINMVILLSIKARFIAEPLFSLARVNTRRNKRLCFPIPFQRYDPTVAKPTYEGHSPGYQYDIQDLKTSVGHYDTNNWGPAIFFLSDYLNARELLSAEREKILETASQSPLSSMKNNFDLIGLPVHWNHSLSTRPDEQPSLEWDLPHLFLTYSNFLEHYKYEELSENGKMAGNQVITDWNTPANMLKLQAREFELFRYIEPNLVMEHDSWEIINCPTLDLSADTIGSDQPNPRSHVTGYTFAMTGQVCRTRNHNNVGTNVQMSFKIFERRMGINMTQYEAIMEAERKAKKAKHIAAHARH